MAERTLPEAAWTAREDLAALVAALGEGNARYVGGAVRDTLLGRSVSDIDIATPLLPDEVMARLEAAGIRTVPTGLEHGTVTAVLEGGPVEITTLRRDVETDGRRAVVAFSEDWREDAARRDFTINALYADPATGAISDWFGGLEDLERGCVRFIGDAEQRIREDHLRILRYFRFAARFGEQTPHDASQKACAELAPMLKGLSRERIGKEMLALLALPDPAPTVEQMAQLGVLKVILPEAAPARLAQLVANERREDVAPDALRRLAALLPPDPALAQEIASRFRLSNAQKKRLVLAAERGPQTEDPRSLAYRLGRTEAEDRLLLAGQSVAPLEDWDIPELPLKGGEIVARGVGAGPEVARILQAVEGQWIAESFPDRARTLAILESLIESEKTGRTR